jgi:hypothetical protein
MLKVIMGFHDHIQIALKAGAPLAQVTDLPMVAEIARMKELPVDEAKDEIKGLEERTRLAFEGLGVS